MTATKQTWSVRSETQPDKTYTVTKDGDAYSCSCPHWVYRRQKCKHIFAVKDERVGFEPSPKPFVLANVGEVTETDDEFLLPLIPLDHRTTDVLATILYDLMCLGVSWGAARERYADMIPREWSKLAVIEHVERKGRMVWRKTGSTARDGKYVTLPVERPLSLRVTG